MLNGSKFEAQQKVFSDEKNYVTLGENRPTARADDNNRAERKSYGEIN